MSLVLKLLNIFWTKLNASSDKLVIVLSILFTYLLLLTLTIFIILGTIL